MMRLRVTVVALVVVWFASSFAARGSQSWRPTALVLNGHVRVSTSADRLVTLVAVDLDTPTSSADGIIDYAFRVQHLEPTLVASGGSGRVTFRDDRLVASVEGKTVAFFPRRAATPPVEWPGTWQVQGVAGITRFWGPALHAPYETVEARLLVPGCAASLALVEGPPGCGDCQVGGGGASGCTIECGDEICEATCGDGYYACCNCSGFCGCCADTVRL